MYLIKDLKILKFRDHITQQQNPQLLSSFKIFHCGHTHSTTTQ